MIEYESFLFGSAARGDNDVNSDTDVLIVYGNHVPNLEIRDNAKSSISIRLGAKCSFAEYTQEHLNRMFSAGHLFTWHLYLEAKRLTPTGSLDETSNNFCQPAPYENALIDASNFGSLIKSAHDSLLSGSKSFIYEAGIAYVALRNIGMCLSASFSESFHFGRLSPFLLSSQLGIEPGCPLAIYNELVSARHASQRGLDYTKLERKEILQGIGLARAWANELIEAVNDY
ncbi:nucleotidyltransferase domain-containing protein [Pseudomonas putida]